MTQATISFSEEDIREILIEEAKRYCPNACDPTSANIKFLDGASKGELAYFIRVDVSFVPIK